MARHEVVSKHLLRRRARVKLHVLEALKRKANIDRDAAAIVALKAAGITRNDVLEVAHAGRVRARWVVRKR